jgi:hypothetical protein
MEPFCSPCTSMSSPVRAVLTLLQAGRERRDQNRLGGTNGTGPQQPPELTLCPSCGAVDAGYRDVAPGAIWGDLMPPDHARPWTRRMTAATECGRAMTHIHSRSRRSARTTGPVGRRLRCVQTWQFCAADRGDLAILKAAPSRHYACFDAAGIVLPVTSVSAPAEPGRPLYGRAWLTLSPTKPAKVSAQPLTSLHLGSPEQAQSGQRRRAKQRHHEPVARTLPESWPVLSPSSAVTGGSAGRADKTRRLTRLPEPAQRTTQPALATHARQPRQGQYSAYLPPGQCASRTRNHSPDPDVRPLPRL